MVWANWGKREQSLNVFVSKTTSGKQRLAEFLARLDYSEAFFGTNQIQIVHFLHRKDAFSKSLNERKRENKMKNIDSRKFMAMAAVALMTCFIGCEAPSVTSGDTAETTKVALDADLCGACGCCADCEDCCKGEKCDCGMQKGSALCCSGVASKEGVKYCKSCGFEKGTESCCSESNTACTKCGLAEGSPICCKVKDSDHKHEEHAHAEGEKHEDESHE